MKRSHVPMILVLVATASFVCTGCSSSPPAQTGFLGDYSRLEPDGSTRLVYVDKAALGKYETFIIDPIKVHFHDESNAAKVKAQGKLKQEDVDDLKNYMHEALEQAIRDGGYKIVYRPAPEVARIRLALTDIKKSTPALNVIPHTKMTGLGLGSAAMEGEIIDSQTRVQLAAVVQGQQGSRVSFAGVKTWGDVKAVIDQWAMNFVKKLDTAHGK